MFPNKLNLCTHVYTGSVLATPPLSTQKRGSKNLALENKKECGLSLATQKTLQVHFRLTPEQKENLTNKAQSARLSVTEYLLALSERKKIYVVDGLPELCVQIIKIGTNINQVTHTINANRSVSEKQIECLNSNLIEIQNLLGKMIDKIKCSTDDEIKV